MAASTGASASRALCPSTCQRAALNFSVPNFSVSFFSRQMIRVIRGLLLSARLLPKTK
jgi:hypothetical protein